jgi:CLIP-associating protein 1/2
MRTPSEAVLNDALRAQANQALSAAEQLLDFDDDDHVQHPGLPVTPSKHSNGSAPVGLGLGSGIGNGNGNGNGHAYGSDLLRTPVNARSRAIWEDSPRNQAVTPTYLEKLKARKYERSWWTRQQECELTHR